MSLPPPTSPTGLKDYVLELEAGKSWGRRKGGVDQLRLSAMGASITHERALQTTLRLPLGTLQLGLVDPGPARAGGMAGRFPMLKRLGATTVIPREEGIEGWLWTGRNGSALPAWVTTRTRRTAALLFAKPLAGDIVEGFAPELGARARRPLAARRSRGRRAAPPRRRRAAGRDVFREVGLLRPVTDREVPPTLRRALPTDRPADPTLRLGGDEARAATSVAPPGLG